MATYTENYNLKMPSGQDAPDVEDFNTNAEIIDTVLKAHSDNTADEYSPDETYTAGRLVIQNNALWKAKQNISVPEPWTPAHWDATTIAAELKAQAEDISALNSSYGENENGSYLRLPDGTQLCWLNTIVTDQAINTLYTSGVYQGIRNWTFPIPFIDSPSVSCGCFKHGTGASWGTANASTPTEAGLRAYDFVSREAGDNCLIQAVAIGRWKS